MTPKMNISEAVYGRISTCNAHWQAAALTSHHMLHTAILHPPSNCLVTSLQWCLRSTSELSLHSKLKTNVTENSHLCSQTSPCYGVHCTAVPAWSLIPDSCLISMWESSMLAKTSLLVLCIPPKPTGHDTRSTTSPSAEYNWPKKNKEFCFCRRLRWDCVSGHD